MSRAEDITYREGGGVDWPRLYHSGKRVSLLGREGSLFIVPFAAPDDALVAIMPIAHDSVEEVYGQLVAAAKLAEGLAGFKGLMPVVSDVLRGWRRSPHGA